MRAVVAIRRAKGSVRPQTEQLDGNTYNWKRGWKMDEDDPYPGEVAWLADDDSYPYDAPIWIASGDLVEIPA